MKASTVLIGAGVAAGGVLLVRALLKRRTEEQGGDPCAAARDIAEKAMPGTGAAAYLACKALSGIHLGEKDWTADDEDNKRLNGEIDLPAKGVQWLAMSSALAKTPYLNGTVLRFKNGCVPIKGAPGWERCAQGTHNMTFSGDGYMWFAVGSDGERVGIEADPSATFSGRVGDVTTGPVIAGLQGWQGAKEARDLFPLPLKPDEDGWWWKGRAFKCKHVVDHRSGSMINGVPRPVFPAWGKLGSDGMPTCGWVVSDEPPPPVASSGGGEWWNPVQSHTELRCSGGKAPAGYTWVDATSSRPGHWERLRAGQAPNNGPCDPNYRPPTQSTSIRSQLRAVTAATLAIAP